jgi:hypothetical protein
MNIAITGYRSDDGFKTAIVAEGTKLLHIVLIESTGVRVLDRPRTEARRFSRLTYKGDDYPLTRAARHFRAAMRTFGGTQAAAAIIKAAEQQAKAR